ncbi:helix-turn-helix domain-containing protein [Nonomuraea sp. NPDC050556]|uniref:helix-turn-helix domain-containing protein n=1 Tax=Nonomuraea sp. NPDC050556 TaxID=3364369 RepID=UPI0037A29C28
MTTSDLVGLRIKTVRRQRGLSQAQLAHPELSDSYISLIESGKRTPTPAVLELLAQKLDCSLSYLVNGVTAEQMEDLELSLGYARLALENGEVSEARTRFSELLANNNLTGLTALRQDAQFGLALATEADGDLSQAIVLLDRLLGDDLAPERRIEVTVALCRTYRTSERLTEAVEVGEQILGGAVRPVWSDLMVELGATLLAAYLDRGDLLRSRQFAAELLNAADTLGTPRSVVAANWNAALTALYTDHGEEALVFAERAMAVQTEHGEPRNTARMRLALAALMLRTRSQDVSTARDLMRRALGDMEQTSAGVVDVARCKIEIARAEIMAGNLDQTIVDAAEGLSLLPATAPSVGLEGDLLLSRAFGATGRFSEAREHIDRARDWLEPIPDARRTAGAWYATAETLELLGEGEEAVGAYQRALACAGL